LNEFELIGRYFHFSRAAVDGDTLGVGDDCALLALPAGEHLAISTDTLVSGVHFPADAPPGLLAKRALRVNLSDLAAMGADPLGFQLAITLPAVDAEWLNGFSTALAEDALLFNCPLLGGDTTKGALAMTLTVLGRVPRNRALLRSGAQAGDLIYVTGTLGDAAAGLHCLQSGQTNDFLLDRYWQPTPRVDVGKALQGLASAALDISDGLLQDVSHLARASGLGAVVDRNAIPLSAAIRAIAAPEQGYSWALFGGDDYELCFTLPPQHRAAMEQAMAAIGVQVTAIGRMVPYGGDLVQCLDERGSAVTVEASGYDHFRS